MIEKIIGWFRSVLKALFPEDVLTQIREAAGTDGEGEGEGSGSARSGQKNAAAVPELSEEERERMKETEAERRHIRFFGRVQGVGFRYHVMYDARNYGLTGWVANLSDGSVEMEIQGPSALIDYVLQNLGNGRWIRIEQMDSQKIPLVRDERGFQVRGY